MYTYVCVYICLVDTRHAPRLQQHKIEHQPRLRVINRHQTPQKTTHLANQKKTDITDDTHQRKTNKTDSTRDIYQYIYIYIYLYIYMCIYTFIYICIYMCIQTHVCTDARHIPIYIYTYTYTYMYIYVYTDTHISHTCRHETRTQTPSAQNWAPATTSCSQHTQPRQPRPCLQSPAVCVEFVGDSSWLAYNFTLIMIQLVISELHELVLFRLCKCMDIYIYTYIGLLLKNWCFNNAQKFGPSSGVMRNRCAPSTATHDVSKWDTFLTPPKKGHVKIEWCRDQNTVYKISIDPSAQRIDWTCKACVCFAKTWRI